MSDSPNPPDDSRGRLLPFLLGVTGLAVGLLLLARRQLVVGTIVLSIGCLSLGWSIGGFGGGGYGASDS